MLNIVDNLCEGLITVASECASLSSMNKTVPNTVNQNIQKKALTSRQRRAKLQISVSLTTSSNTIGQSLEELKTDATTKKVQLVKEEAKNNWVANKKFESDASDSDDEVSASDLIPEYHQLQNYRNCSKSNETHLKTTSLAGNKRSRREAGQATPKQHAPKKRVFKNSTKMTMDGTIEQHLKKPVLMNGKAVFELPQLRSAHA